MTCRHRGQRVDEWSVWHDRVVSGPLPAGFPVTAPGLPRPIFTKQRWSDLTFVHWPVDPGAVAYLYPQGTRPDVFTDGTTYVGLVPFAMTEVALGISRPIPYFGRFLETPPTVTRRGAVGEGQVAA